MTPIQYYRLSWLYPIVVPIVAILLEVLLNHFGIRMPSMISTGIGIIMSAIFLFCIPYAVLVSIMLFVLRRSSEKTYIFLIALSPVLMVLFVSLFLLIAGSSKHDVFDMALFYARFSLFVGYFYVILIFIVRWLIGLMGFLQAPET